MNSVGFDCDRNVDAIVDYYLDTELPGDRHRIERGQIELARRGALLAQLNEGCTSSDQQLDLSRVGQSADEGVGNRVDFGKREGH